MLHLNQPLDEGLAEHLLTFLCKLPCYSHILLNLGKATIHSLAQLPFVGQIDVVSVLFVILLIMCACCCKALSPATCLYLFSSIIVDYPSLLLSCIIFSLLSLFYFRAILAYSDAITSTTTHQQTNNQPHNLGTNSIKQPLYRVYTTFCDLFVVKTDTSRTAIWPWRMISIYPFYNPQTGYINFIFFSTWSPTKVTNNIEVYTEINATKYDAEYPNTHAPT